MWHSNTNSVQYTIGVNNSSFPLITAFMIMNHTLLIELEAIYKSDNSQKTIFQNNKQYLQSSWIYRLHIKYFVSGQILLLL